MSAIAQSKGLVGEFRKHITLKVRMVWLRNTKLAKEQPTTAKPFGSLKKLCAAIDGLYIAHWWVFNFEIGTIRRCKVATSNTNNWKCWKTSTASKPYRLPIWSVLVLLLWQADIQLPISDSRVLDSDSTLHTNYWLDGLSVCDVVCSVFVCKPGDCTSTCNSCIFDSRECTQLMWTYSS